MARRKRTIATDGTPARSQEGMLARLSDEKLAAAVELNSAEFLRLEGRLPWVEFHDDEDARWIFAGDTWPRNSVALARFTTETVRENVSANEVRRSIATDFGNAETQVTDRAFQHE